MRGFELISHLTDGLITLSSRFNTRHTMIADKLLADQNFKFKDGIFYWKDFSLNDFEPAYIEIRKKEGRLLPDSEIRKLPDVDDSHPHVKEWRIRKRSAIRL